MIECKFVFMGSDSIQHICQVHAVPQIGQTIGFDSGGQGFGHHKVKDVAHYINRTEGTHEIVVTYG